MFGAMSFGSIAWGQMATHIGLPASHLIAAAGLVVALSVCGTGSCRPARASISTIDALACAGPGQEHRQRRGPVMVTIEYRIDPNDRGVPRRAARG